MRTARLRTQLERMRAATGALRQLVSASSVPERRDFDLCELLTRAAGLEPATSGVTGHTLRGVSEMGPDLSNEVKQPWRPGLDHRGAIPESLSTSLIAKLGGVSRRPNLSIRGMSVFRRPAGRAWLGERDCGTDRVCGACLPLSPRNGVNVKGGETVPLDPLDPKDELNPEALRFLQGRYGPCRAGAGWLVVACFAGKGSPFLQGLGHG